MILIKIAISLLIAYIAITILAFFLKEKIAFPAPKANYVFGDPFFMIDDKISAIFLKAENAKFTVIYSHGNGEDIGEILPLLKLWQKRGFNILAYDYFGYGHSKGTPSQDNILEAADIAFAWTQKNLGITKENTIIAGYSLGGAAAIHLASQNDVAGLIVMGAFSTAFNAVLPYNIFPFDMLKNIEKINLVSAPVLFIHGTADRIVPYRNCKALYTKRENNKTLLTIQGAGHLDLFDYNPALFWDAINNFTKDL